ncbi:hypothetical protein glysoja_043780 [Glycine soja]|uniref:BZIP domain-containing protein n=1 Tax=Glycine soja TaxID=3848 RepID=A0A0B2R2X4_GLYSO|nr:hypothetical protein glysoja_043780 [Glycine soja]
MENPKENNKVENHHTVNAILSPTFVFSATKLADQFGYAEGNPTPEQQILDPKLRRIFSNRFAAQRSREKKKNHLANLEIQKKTFENEIAQKQRLQDLYENKRQTQIVEEETMYQEIDILKNYSMFKDAEIEKDKGEVIRERELQVIEQQEELQAHLVNLNIGPQEPVSNYPTSNYYANSYPDLVWRGNERTINLEIKGKSVTSNMKISTTQTNTSILEEVGNWLSYKNYIITAGRHR